MVKHCVSLCVRVWGICSYMSSTSLAQLFSADIVAIISQLDGRNLRRKTFVNTRRRVRDKIHR